MRPILVISSAKRIATQILVIAKLNGRKMWLTIKMTCDTLVFLQILLAGRIIRSYLNVDKIAFKLF